MCYNINMKKKKKIKLRSSFGYFDLKKEPFVIKEIKEFISDNTLIGLLFLVVSVLCIIDRVL